MREKISCIYMLKNIENGKFYIGQTRDYRRRKNTHRTLLVNKKHDNKRLQKDFDEFGIEKFEFSILEKCSLDELDKKEIEWFEKLNPIDNGYNVHQPGNGWGNRKFPIESKLSISLKNRKNHKDNPDKYKHTVSDFTKQLIGRATIERNQTKENNPKAHSVVCLNTKYCFPTIIEAAEWCGVSYSAIVKNCICESKSCGKLGKERLVWRYEEDFCNLSADDIEKLITIANDRRSKNRKEVICIETNQIYDSVTQAGLQCDLDPSSIAKCCKGKICSCGKKDGLPLHWKYVEN